MKTNKIITFLCSILISLAAQSEPVTIDSVDYVYVLDTEQSFDFSGGPNHECGSNLYRTFGASEGIVNRKFSVVLTAFSTGKKVVINTEGCDGNRMKFGWVRAYK